jgi:2,4-dienoyl-CoA reductase-like NADH-dependent reductase (Old Yellow Enzyme family)
LVLDQCAKASGLSRVIHHAHDSGVSVSIQLEHAGGQAISKETGQEVIAASPVLCPVTGETPRQITRAEIADSIKAFARAVWLAERAGADFVEIHAAHGYLLSGFLSPALNFREDQYGGNIENRYRILYDLINEIRLRCSINIGLRVNVYEDIKHGQRVDQVIVGLRHLAPALAYVSVSGGIYSQRRDLIMPSRTEGAALWRTEATILRRELLVPTLLAGNIESVALADKLIDDGAADVVLFGRALLTDPRLIDKNLSGREARNCIECGMCKYHSRGERNIYCPFNMALRRNRSDRSSKSIRPE